MADFKAILDRIQQAIVDFNDAIPAAQKEMHAAIAAELKRLDLNGDRIKITVANMKVITSIKNKIQRLILTDNYVQNVKDFAAAFVEISTLQNEYWKAAEAAFKVKPLLREVRNAAIEDTVKQLTEAGIGNVIADEITGILKTNITTGGSYKKLQDQLLQSLTDSGNKDGLLTRYSKQITTDSVNQFSAQYTRAATAGLGFEWYAYQGSDITTTRPFCNAMTDFRYFHITEVPRLLRAEGLFYVKDGVETQVPIYEKTGLPHGMIEGTNEDTFFVYRGGYNCGHQIRGVSEAVVPISIRDRVYNTPEYAAWAQQNA